MDRLKRLLRAIVIVVALAGSLALLPMLGLPYQPLEATAARLSTVLYDQQTRIWLPLIMKDNGTR